MAQAFLYIYSQWNENFVSSLDVNHVISTSTTILYLLKQIKSNIITLILLLVIPALFTLLISYLVTFEMSSKQYKSWKVHELPPLPKAFQSLQYGYTPSNSQTNMIMSQVQNKLKIKELHKYDTYQQAAQQILSANMHQLANQKINKLTLALQQLSFPFAFNHSSFSDFMNTTYKKQYYNMSTDVNNEIQAPIFILFEFDLSNGLNYTIHYDQNAIDQFYANNQDNFVKNYLEFAHFTRITLYSLLGIQLQDAVEKAYLNTCNTKNSNKPLKVGNIYQVPNEIDMLGWEKNFMVYLFPSAMPGILAQFFVSDAKLYFLSVVKKLGGSTLAFWLLCITTTMIFSFAAISLQMITLRFFSIEPYISFDIGVLIFFAAIQAFQQSCINCLISVFLNSSTYQLVTAISIFISFSLFPAFVLSQYYIQKTFWDPCLFSQLISWILMIIIPFLGIYISNDLFAAVGFNWPKNIAKNVENLFSIHFENIKIRSSRGSGFYYLPSIKIVLTVLIIQSIVIFLIAMYISMIADYDNQVGLPMFYFAQKDYYKFNRRPQKSQNCLEVMNLSKKFKIGWRKRFKQVLTDISFVAHPGSVVGIMGLSGCGKTTLCKILQCEEKPDKDSKIQIGDVDLCHKYSQCLQHVVCACPQDKSNIIKNLTIKDNISLYKNYTNFDQSQQEYFDKLLVKLKLNGHEQKYYSQMSGGMQRRLSMYLTLLQIPQILLLDEITANVDPLIKHDIWDVLYEYSTIFKPIMIITSHDSTELQYICNRIIYIKDTEIKQNMGVYELILNNQVKDHKTYLNDIIYGSDIDVSMSVATANQIDSGYSSNEVTPLLSTKFNTINHLLFSWNKRTLWHVNNKFLLLLMVVLFNFVIGFILLLINYVKNQQAKNVIPAEVELQMKTHQLKQSIKQLGITSQQQFEYAFISQQNNTLPLATNQPQYNSMQRFKSIMSFDSLGLTMTFGDDSMFLGENEICNQYINFLVNGTTSDYINQINMKTKRIQCKNVDVGISLIKYRDCVHDNMTNVQQSERICQANEQLFTSAVDINVKSFQEISEFIQKEAKPQNYSARFKNLNEQEKLRKYIKYPLSILQPKQHEDAYFIRMPAISQEYDRFTDVVLVPYQFSENLVNSQISVSLLFPQQTRIVNYQNDYLTRYHAQQLRNTPEHEHDFMQATFKQQPFFPSDIRSTSFRKGMLCGDLQLSSFQGLVIFLSVLTTVINYWTDSHATLLNQLEGIGLNRFKHCASQIFVNFVQIVVLNAIFYIMQVIINFSPQFVAWELYISLLFQSYQYAVMMQILMLIFTKIQYLIILLCSLFLFSLFTTAFINLSEVTSLLMSLVVPGYYYTYLNKLIGRGYALYWPQLISGIILSTIELIIIFLPQIFVARKNNATSQIPLEAEHVGAKIKKVAVLRDVSLKLSQGETIALIGVNGCGKTTFLKCVLRQLKFTGRIASYSGIVVIPQDEIEFEGLTVSQYFKCLRVDASKIMQTFNMGDCVNQKSQQLSGGQKRRLTIAVALALQPDLVVMDEVTVGSDYVMKSKIWQAVREHASTKMVISHDLIEIGQYADNICLIKAGIGQIVQQPTKHYLIVVYNTCLENIQTILRGIIVEPFFDKFFVYCSDQNMQQTIQLLESRNIVFTVEDVSLDGLFTK